eukprot:CAMPEP_0177516572 /NCGR_PEP_ID=MMETSP0369-20130122/45488_1 /TAXON_ID=447022 ORGANISM="Scrippsiella hangoei-like, Strain SHHI-4" /NCGR_SAMPLE_ID=MMETSP0369 /ASSEMBLY_ACC=CAM_ASM_000364 /LENGTH=153 /DNA_ID=CAMNT_0018995471 /DNA_START=695 /DNA_END=1156 /DNA_ORIENTATION=+
MAKEVAAQTHRLHQPRCRSSNLPSMHTPSLGIHELLALLGPPHILGRNSSQDAIFPLWSHLSVPLLEELVNVGDDYQGLHILVLRHLSQQVVCGLPHVATGLHDPKQRHTPGKPTPGSQQQPQHVVAMHLLSISEAWRVDSIDRTKMLIVVRM